MSTVKQQLHTTTMMNRRKGQQQQQTHDHFIHHNHSTSTTTNHDNSLSQQNPQRILSSLWPSSNSQQNNNNNNHSQRTVVQSQPPPPSYHNPLSTTIVHHQQQHLNVFQYVFHSIGFTSIPPVSTYIRLVVSCIGLWMMTNLLLCMKLSKYIPVLSNSSSLSSSPSTMAVSYFTSSFHDNNMTMTLSDIEEHFAEQCFRNVTNLNSTAQYKSSIALRRQEIKNRFKIHNQQQKQQIQQQMVSSQSQSQSPTIMIEMIQLKNELPYDNVDGGVWKQGFELHPILNITTLTTTTTATTSTTTQQIRSDSTLSSIIPFLTIYVVPHSHVDSFKSNNDRVFPLLDNIINALWENKSRTFLWSDMYLLEEYYTFHNTTTTPTSTDNNHNNPSMITKLTQLIQNKQFELVFNSVIDEAITDYSIHEMQLQNDIFFIMNAFGLQSLPHYIWSLESAGVSTSIPHHLYNQLYHIQQSHSKQQQTSSDTLGIQQNNNVIKGIVVQNVHYHIKKHLALHKQLEFYWQQQIPMTDTKRLNNPNDILIGMDDDDDNDTIVVENNIDIDINNNENSHDIMNATDRISQQRRRRLSATAASDAQQQQKQQRHGGGVGDSTNIFTHVLPFYTYDIPHTCGPDPKICCQYDFELLAMKKSKSSTKIVCPWGIDPIEINNENIKERAYTLLDQYLKKASLFQYKTLLVPLGGEYKYETNTNIVFQNYELLFHYINENIPGIQIQFGTLSDYFHTTQRNQYQLKQQQQEQEYILNNNNLQKQNEEEILESKNELKTRNLIVDNHNNLTMQTTFFENEVVSIPILKGSFFPFADRDHEYVTSYYTESTMDRILNIKLHRLLYIADTLGVPISELKFPRRTMTLLYNYYVIRSPPPTKFFNLLEAVENDRTRAMSFTMKSIRANLLTLLNTHLNVSSEAMKELDQTMHYCGSYSDLHYVETDYTFSCKINKNPVIVYNPLRVQQQVCGSHIINSLEFRRINVPCDDNTPSYLVDQKSFNNKTTTGSNVEIIRPVLFDNATGFMLQPIKEEWKVSKTEKSVGFGFYFPSGELNDIEWTDEVHKPTIEKGGYIVKSLSCSRVVRIRRQQQEELDGISLYDSIDNVVVDRTVLDFYYQTRTAGVYVDGLAVRFGLDGLKNKRIIYTDLNGLGIEKNEYRKNILLPFHSQVVPMSSLSFIQNDNNTRITIISEYGHGVAASKEGFIDIFFNRGLIGKISPLSSMISTRLRVVVEVSKEPTNDFMNPTITPYTRMLWDEVKHPLAFFGVEKPIVVKTVGTATATKRTPMGYTMTATLEGIKTKLYNKENTFVPFVFMVYKRVSYLEQVIDSLRKSDFPKATVPIIISHDGHVPEMIEYVETLKSEFKVIQLFHPYSCYDHTDSFPGGNDTNLNIGYAGDSYGNQREAKVTCCKHHFTWILQRVFSLGMEELYGPGTTRSPSGSDTFFFTEEDYLLGPVIYNSIVSGLNAMNELHNKTKAGTGFFGIGFEPKTRRIPRTVDAWYAAAFVSGPMTINRSIFNGIKTHADRYCMYDDYNWDWSIVNLQYENFIPYTTLLPSQYNVKHIGVEGGMHSNQAKKTEKGLRMVQLSDNFQGTSVAGVVSVMLDRRKRNNGGWGHPVDQEHCRKLFQDN